MPSSKGSGISLAYRLSLLAILPQGSLHVLLLTLDCLQLDVVLENVTEGTGSNVGRLNVTVCAKVPELFNVQGFARAGSKRYGEKVHMRRQ